MRTRSLTYREPTYHHVVLVWSGHLRMELPGMLEPAACFEFPVSMGLGETEE